MESLEVERWRNLCELAAKEQDRQKLQGLVLELTKRSFSGRIRV